MALPNIVGIKNVGGKAGLYAGVNLKYITATTADYIFTNWQEYIEQLPQILNHYFPSPK